MNIKRRDFIKIASVAGAHFAIIKTARGAEIVSLASGAETNRALAGDLAQAFKKIPASARPGTYWWWLDGLVNRKGITRDLEEFRAKGIRDVLLVNSTNLGPKRTPDDGCRFLSEAWLDCYKHALSEAARLGIDVGVNLSGGWCMGGPWIEPRYSGRWFLQSQCTVTGPKKFSGPLPLPGGRSGYDNVFNAPGYKDYIDLPLEKLDYRDTCVVAFRDDSGGAARIGDKERLDLLAAKTNRKDASNFTRAQDVMGPALARWGAHVSDKPVAPQDVVDLTSRVTADGRLDWDVPPGNWIIVRTGHRMTGSRLLVAPPEADGLSVDWLAARPVDIQFEHLGKIFLDGARGHVGKTLKYFCDDSFEDGFPNWTESILEKFEVYRGYNPRPYLPVLAGYLVGGAEVSDRFLHDYRKTVADCMADGHYGRFAALCREHGLLVQNEAAGPSRSGTMCMDALKNLGRSDFPAGEFWLGAKHDTAEGANPKLGYGVARLEDGQNKVTKMVASAAHIYGRKTASAEAFTSKPGQRAWHEAPWSLKQAGDRAFCEGINRLMIHASTASRPEDGKPGYVYNAGTHFGPNLTWWNHAGAFLDYLGRCQHMLQQGLFVADVLYYTGDWAPNIVPPKHIDPSLGYGYDYDACNAEVLLTRLSVSPKDGRLCLPNGMSYRLLVLPETERMPLEVLEKIEQLVAAGATVSGPRPACDSGLKNYPQCDLSVAKIAGDLWGACDGKQHKVNRHGKGRVFWGTPLHDILRADGIGPDFACEKNPDAAARATGVARMSGTGIDYIHRSISGKNAAEVYFVANQAAVAQSNVCSFRVAGRVPQIWDPVDGSVREAAAFREEGGRTLIPLEFAALQSFFIIFPKGKTARSKPPAPGEGGNGGRNFPAYKPVQRLTGAWTVTFDPAWGGPAETEFPELKDWTLSGDHRIKYYSGSALYIKRFIFEQPRANAGVRASRFVLNLGAVGDVAGVKINGRDFGTVWTAPWQVDITEALRGGENLIEIEVVNKWRNRLIGDASLSREQRLTRTNILLEANTPLTESGLLGPVDILEAVL